MKRNGLPNSIKQLKFKKKNPRHHSDRNKAVTRESLEVIGPARSVVIDENGKILTGEGVVSEALALGIKKIIPVEGSRDALVAVVRRDLSEREKVQLDIYDNRSGELATWDADIMTEFADDVLMDFSTLFDDAELDRILIDSEGDLEDDGAKEKKWQTNARELQKIWKVKTGQHWKVGKHTVICGDASALKFDVDLVCTDPPYELSAAETIGVIGRYAPRAIVLCADRLAFQLGSLWSFSLDLIWSHPQAKLLGVKMHDGLRTMPVFYHAHCLVITKSAKVKTGWRRPNPKFGSIIEANYSDKGHGHGKSVELFEKMLAGFPWRKVCDPFLGSGATLLACEAQNRICLGIEREPITVAIALQRCKDYGLKPKLQ